MYPAPRTFSSRGGAPGNAARNLDAIYCISFYQSNDFPISHIDKDLLYDILDSIMRGTFDEDESVKFRYYAAIAEE